MKATLMNSTLPNDVYLGDPLTPLVDAFGKAELEQAGGLMVLCARKLNRWDWISIDAIVSILTGNPKHYNVPFFRPDAHGLVKSGFAQWQDEPGKTIRFTEEGLYCLFNRAHWSKEKDGAP